MQNLLSSSQQTGKKWEGKGQQDPDEQFSRLVECPGNGLYTYLQNHAHVDLESPFQCLGPHAAGDVRASSSDVQPVLVVHLNIPSGFVAEISDIVKSMGKGRKWREGVQCVMTNLGIRRGAVNRANTAKQLKQ